MFNNFRYLPDCGGEQFRQSSSWLDNPDEPGGPENAENQGSERNGIIKSRKIFI